METSKSSVWLVRAVVAKAAYPVVYGMLMPPRLMLSQPTMNRVEKHSRDTPLQIMASLADSRAPNFSFLMM